MDNRKNMSDRIDGYGNAITAMGTSADKSSGAFFVPNRWLGSAELSDLYAGDALAARVVDRIVDDATRTKYRLTGTDQNIDWASIQSELDDLQAIQRLGEAWKWARLYGGAIVVMAIDDGRPYSEPVDKASIRRLSALSVVDSANVIPVGFVPGLGSAAYAEPEQYEIVVPWGGRSEPNANRRLIHKSRCIRFDGVSVPASEMIRNGGWGPGVLQRIWSQLKRLGQAEAYAENLLHELSILVFKIDGFKEMLCGGEGNADTARQLLEQLKWGIDNLHVLGLDADDDFQEITRTVAGVDALLTKFENAVVRSTEYPRNILLGEHPGGLNAATTAQSELDGYYDAISTQQEILLAPRINRVLEVLFAARANRGEPVPSEWSVEFESLVQEDNAEKADNALKWAQTAQVLITMGVVSADEMRKQLAETGYIETIDPVDLDVTEIPELYADPTTAGETPDVGSEA